MSDFVIKRKDDTEFGVDDILMDPNSKVVKYIERYNHQRRMIMLDDIKEIRRERWGNEGGPSFDEDERPSGWKRPV
jgi:hypothetical protein